MRAKSRIASITESHGLSAITRSASDGPVEASSSAHGAGVLRDEMHGGADARHLDAGVAREAGLGAETGDPDALRRGEAVGNAAEQVRAQVLEGAGEVRHLDLKMGRHRRGALRRLDRHGDLMHRAGTVALLAGLQTHIVEIGVAEVAEKARRRRLGDASEAGELGRREW